jgi:hypothetical protein
MERLANVEILFGRMRVDRASTIRIATLEKSAIGIPMACSGASPPVLLALQFNHLLNTRKVFFTHQPVEHANPNDLIRRTLDFPALTLPAIWPCLVTHCGWIALFIIDSPATVDGIFQYKPHVGPRQIETSPNLCVAGLS